MSRFVRKCSVVVFFALLSSCFVSSLCAQADPESSPKVTDPAELTLPEGFTAELIYNVPSDELGSWVSLTNGPDGILIVCDQGDKGMCSIKVTETEDGPKAKVTPIKVKAPGSDEILSGAQGLLWAFDALWFHKNGGHLYKITFDKDDWSLFKTEQLPSQTGGGEHGNHALILSEDSQSMYMCGGNHAPLHKTRRNAVQSWDEDLLLSRMWDGNGHARGILAPGGWVTRLDPKTMEQELVCIGFRNQYDIVLNRHGDMFTFDADMEWDMGMPWYRPTRICHCVSGADFGWRSGTGKWPTYFEDSLPSVVDIGPGSPTGMCSGIGAKFPAKYQDALFALDWTFGTIYAVHLTPSGASYTGEVEPFVTGAPLPVTDAIVGADGHLYFTVGGRRTQSGLYRVRYTGSESTAASPPVEFSEDVQAARKIRKHLEQFHGREDVNAEHTFMKHMSSPDRFIRNAARVAVESQPSNSSWSNWITESDPQLRITTAVALARMGNKERDQHRILQSLLELNPEEPGEPDPDDPDAVPDGLTESQFLGLLRAYSLCFSRMGLPKDDSARSPYSLDNPYGSLTAGPHRFSRVFKQLDAQLPHKNDDVNTELIRLLVFLESPTVVAKTMDLIRNRKPPIVPDWTELTSRNSTYGGPIRSVMENHPPREIQYALMLRNLRKGWTKELRREYFEFLNEAAKASGGNSFPKFMANIRDEALENCTDEERKAVEDITGEDFEPVPDFEIKPIVGPGKKWSVDEALAVTKKFRDADFENGRSLYFAATCGACHRFDGLGGSVGPGLTSIRNKFDVRYVVDHIIHPSKTISDQYQSYGVETAGGRTLSGLVAKEDGKVVVYSSDANADPIRLSPDDVESLKPSSTSQMPEGLLDNLNADEVRDLLAYLMSGGNPNEKKIYGN